MLGVLELNVLLFLVCCLIQTSNLSSLSFSCFPAPAIPANRPFGRRALALAQALKQEGNRFENSSLLVGRLKRGHCSFTVFDHHSH